MNILIYKDEQELGPYSPEDIDIHLKSGTLALEDLAWVEGENDWKPLRDVLATRRAAPRIATSGLVGAAQESEQEASRESPGGIESILGKAQATALLSQKQAQRKMIEMVDLRPAYQQLGKKAYESGNLPSRYAPFVSPIDRMMAEIQSLQQQKGGAGAPARAAKVQGLTLKLNQLFRNLGTVLREGGLEGPALKREMDLANSAYASAAALDREICELSAKAYPWARRPLLILAVLAGAFLLYFGFGKIRAGQSTPVPAAETHKSQAAENDTKRDMEDTQEAGSR